VTVQQAAAVICCCLPTYVSSFRNIDIRSWLQHFDISSWLRSIHIRSWLQKIDIRSWLQKNDLPPWLRQKDIRSRLPNIDIPTLPRNWYDSLTHRISNIAGRSGRSKPQGHADVSAYNTIEGRQYDFLDNSINLEENNNSWGLAPVKSLVPNGGNIDDATYTLIRIKFLRILADVSE
jgi:hypothetical protein